MATWPVTLPQSVLVTGYQEQPPRTFIRTDMETGAAKQRQRFTAAPRSVTCRIMVTAAQLDTFEDFFFNDLGGGAASFDWKHPRTSEAATLRFTDVPTYTEHTPNLYEVQLPLEILP